MPNIHLIWAQAHHRVIGHKGIMPWHLPEDFAHFKRTTQGHPVIMGRKTWDSIPARFRPLPGRLNMVITHQADWLEGQSASGLQAYSSLQAALDAASQHAEVWVIGGAQIYAQALPLAHKLVVTHIDADFEGDALAPEIDDNWVETQRESHTSASSVPALSFAFVTYQRLAS